MQNLKLMTEMLSKLAIVLIVLITISISSILVWKWWSRISSCWLELTGAKGAAVLNIGNLNITFPDQMSNFQLLMRIQGILPWISTHWQRRTDMKQHRFTSPTHHGVMNQHLHCVKCNSSIQFNNVVQQVYLTKKNKNSKMNKPPVNQKHINKLHYT